MKEIEHKGQKVQCYGDLQNGYMNFLIVATAANGEEIDVMDTTGHKTWEVAVPAVVDYFLKNYGEGSEVHELQAM